MHDMYNTDGMFVNRDNDSIEMDAQRDNQHEDGSQVV